MGLVVLGSLSFCQPCKDLHKKMVEDGVSFESVDVSEAGAMTLKEKMIACGVRSIPAIFIDGEFKGSGIEVYKDLKLNGGIA